ncbi:hypothetical protein [Microbacterium deminutum]|uniref:Fimbrial assembly protein n=1 Tax=Microbacterium deminutum TaxID=344164 RepID=A0ABN2QBB3_9MICO
MSVAAPTLTRSGIPRVNLMPRLETERRARDRVVRAWLWGIVATVVVAFLVVLGVFGLKWVADQGLAAEQARTNTLLTELAGLSDVSGALATEQELGAFRAEAMGSDFVWAPVINSLASGLPADVRLTGFDLVTGGIPQPGESASGVGLVGTLTLSSPNAIDIAPTVRRFRQLPGVSHVDGRLVSSSQQAVGSYTYELSISFDQSIYSGAFSEGAH